MRTCRKCDETKPLDQFQRRENGSHRWDCIECQRRYHRDRRKTPRGALYTVWSNMIARCNNSNDKSYSNYGGRGITIGFRDFDHFFEWSLANGYAFGLEIDRVDNDGPYSPDNCRWVTRSENQLSTRRNRHITAFGETKTLKEWVDDPRCAVGRDALKHRLSSNWNPERAISTPSRDQTRTLTAFGETKTVTEWVDDPRCAVSRNGLDYRLNNGWEPERAISTPSNRHV